MDSFSGKASTGKFYPLSCMINQESLINSRRGAIRAGGARRGRPEGGDLHANRREKTR
jgi:hypothetical protein